MAQAASAGASSISTFTEKSGSIHVVNGVISSAGPVSVVTQARLTPPGAHTTVACSGSNPAVTVCAM